MTRPPDGPDFEPEQPGLPLEPDDQDAGAVYQPPWAPAPPPEDAAPPPEDAAARGAQRSSEEPRPGEEQAAGAPERRRALGPIPPPAAGREPLRAAADLPPAPGPPAPDPRAPGPRERSFASTDPDEPDPRRFAPVIFDDDERRGPPTPFAEYDDSGVLRVLGVVVLLGIIIAVLVLPPISILDRGGGGGGSSGGIRASARGDLPDLPAGLVAVSRLYDLEAGDELGPDGPWELSVKLSETTTDPRNLALYTYEGDAWQRLTSATIGAEGTLALANVEVIPANVAVLRRTAFERSLALVVPAGQAPDEAALAAASIVAVTAGSIGIGDDGGAALSVDAAAVDAAAIADATVYLGVTVEPDARAALDQLLGTEPALVAHVGELAAAVTDSGANGLYLAYLDVDPTRRAGLTRLVTQLQERLAELGLGLVVGLPAPATADTGAYDWAALAEVADGLWLHAPADPAVYYEQLQVVLDAQQAAGLPMGSLSLVIDRMSHLRDSQGVASIDRHDALGRAAILEAGASGIAVDDLVSLTATNLATDLGNSGLRWDNTARAVSFSFAERSGPRTVWIENAFSFAFRLDLAQRFELGGVVVANAQPDDALPDVWEPVMAYLDSGAVNLLRPYGPYLAPCWQAVDGVVEGEAGNCWAGADASGIATWRAPAAPGVYNVRLLVSDGEAFVGRQLALRVTEDGEQPDPTPEPTEEPTAEPTSEATPDATEEATPEPTEVPTEQPTEQPTATPTEEPTATGTPGGGPPGPGGNE